MSKKKLNKRGQQAKNKVQNSKNSAPRIDASKTIYEVDAKVQAYSASECAEEADVALGVVAGGTEIVDPVTEEVVEVVGENEPMDDDTTPIEDDEEADEDDIIEDDEIIEDDDDIDDADEDEEDEENIRPIRNKRRSRAETNAMHAKLKKTASTIDCANENPDIIDTNSYGDKIISAIHKAKEVIDAKGNDIANRMRNKRLAKVFSPRDEITFSGEFINWDNTGYSNSASVMSALEKQYNDFMSKKILALNDPDVDNVYYCNDIKMMTSGILMHTGTGIMPIRGNAATITIYVPAEKRDEFIEKYTTKICLCQTSDKIPPHIMALAAEGLAPVDGIRAYYIVDMPKFLKLFAAERNRNIHLYDSPEGYSILVANYDGVNNNSVSLAAPAYKTSLTIGMAKAMHY